MPPTDIYAMRADGSHLKRVTRTGRAFSPVWSPDGKTLAFSNRGPSSTEGVPPLSIWLVGADGTSPHQLIRAVGHEIDVPGDWSPDGSLLAFTRSGFPDFGQMPIEQRSAVYVVSPDGSGLRKLVDHAADPAWAPGARQIAFASDRDHNGVLSYGDLATYASELHVMRSDGTGVRRFTQTRDLNERFPSWSPDGRWIAFQQGRVIDNAQGTIVLALRPDGRCPTRIAGDSNLDTWFGTPVWEPAQATGRFGRC